MRAGRSAPVAAMKNRNVLIEDTFNYTIFPAGRISWWNGTTWVKKPVMVWNGSAWVEKPVLYWNGSAWVKTKS